MIFSYTLIDTFHNVCPRQAYERFVKKSIPFVETPEMKKGKEAHKALEKRLSHSYPLPGGLAACEPVAKAIDARGIPFVEKRFGVDRNLNHTGFFDTDVWLRGNVDVQLMSKEYAGAFIVDWKTGKNREGGKEPWQLMIYAGATFAEYPECQRVTAVNVYTGTGQMGTAHTWTYTEAPAIWRTIVPLMQEIEYAEQTGKWPETPGPLCGWCPVVKCQHNKARN